MILDATNQFIKNILNFVNLNGKTILEIGCGSGRITRDLAKYAKLVIAIDKNKASLSKAKETIKSTNVIFMNINGENLSDLPYNFDLVIYSLSLHHISKRSMLKSLKESSKKLSKEGKIIIIEPGKNGTFIEIEKEFLVGDSNEEELKIAAYNSINNLKGWRIKNRADFQTIFYFDSVFDFFDSIVQDNWKGDREKLTHFLKNYEKDNKIELNAERVIYVLEREIK